MVDVDAGEAAVASFLALCLLLVGMGAVAVVAEFTRSWGAYFLMERAMAVTAPVTVAVAGFTLVTGFLAVFRA